MPATIINVKKHYYYLDISYEEFCWTDEMLEPINENKQFMNLNKFRRVIKMKYKVGDKVRVRKDLDEERFYNGIPVEKSMIDNYGGEKAIIKSIQKLCDGFSGYFLDISGNNWLWADDMLEPIIENKPFAKEDFKFGDVITLRGFQEAKFVFINNSIYNEGKLELASYNEELKYKFDFEDYDIMKVQRYFKNPTGSYDLITLYSRKEILDEKEKEYLSKVIAPFRDKVLGIRKISTFKSEYISIDIARECEIPFPYFEKNTMYKGMELNKKYTLKELGI